MASASANTDSGEARNTLSFTILNDLFHAPGFPQHVSYVKGTTDAEEKLAILAQVNLVLQPLRDQALPSEDSSSPTHDDPIRDPSGFFDKYWFRNQQHPSCVGHSPYLKDIADALAKNGAFVLNRVNKYYVIAFAINRKRFAVYSKDCNTQQIKWSDDDETIVRDSPDPRNQNPVVALMKTIHGTGADDAKAPQ